MKRFERHMLTVATALKALGTALNLWLAFVPRNKDQLILDWQLDVCREDLETAQLHISGLYLALGASCLVSFVLAVLLAHRCCCRRFRGEVLKSSVAQTDGSTGASSDSDRHAQQLGLRAGFRPRARRGIVE